MLTLLKGSKSAAGNPSDGVLPVGFGSATKIVAVMRLAETNEINLPDETVDSAGVQKRKLTGKQAMAAKAVEQPDAAQAAYRSKSAQRGGRVRS